MSDVHDDNNCNVDDNDDANDNKIDNDGVITKIIEVRIISIAIIVAMTRMQKLPRKRQKIEWFIN